MIWTQNGPPFGAFGPGWNSSFEVRLDQTQSYLAAARNADGNPQYYFAKDGSGVMKSVLPPSSESWVTSTTCPTDLPPGFCYKRLFRAGGFETYFARAPGARGFLLSTTDPSAVVTTYTYDTQTRLTSVSRLGRSIVLDYSGISTQPWHLRDGKGTVLATYGYTEGFLSSVTYADGSGYQYIPSTSSPPRVAAVLDLAGKKVEAHEYYPDGKAMTSEIGDGVERLTFSYGAGENKVPVHVGNGVYEDITIQTNTVTDARGNVATYKVSNRGGMGRVTEATGPCSSCGGGQGTTGTWVYDETGNITSYTNGTGHTWTYTYDPATGDLLTETSPRPVRGQDASTYTYTYFPDGRVKTKTDPLGAVTSYTYGPAGPLSITEYVTATRTRTTDLTYTPEGKLKTIEDPRDKKTTLDYNSFGDLISVINPLEKETSFGYDPLGRRTSVTDPLQHTTTTTYGDGVHVTRITNHDLTHTDFTYDLGGRRTSVTDTMGRVTEYGYDDYGRLRTVTTKPSATEPSNGVTTYDYDVMSNLTSITDARGKVTSFTYNGFNRVETVTYPGNMRGSVESFTYDAAGRLATRTDRKGVVTTYAYDVRGRLIRKDYSDGTRAVTYDYDKVGRLLSAANSTDSLGWSYDLAGQMLSEASTRNGSAVTYAYDLGGNRESLSLDAVPFLTYGYDDASQLKTITRGTAVFGLDYDDASRRKSLTYPNGIITTYSYDDLNRVTGLKADLGFTPITDFQYDHDAAGNRTIKQQLDYTEEYSYDPLYRLKGVLRTGGLTGTWEFGYDEVGNRTTSQLNGLLSTSVYNDRNELTSTSGATTAAHSYDPNGNLTQKVEGADTWTYEWNAENELKRVLKNGVEQARFSYDPMGRRVEKVAGGVTTSYVYDSVDILREQSSGGTTLKYIHTPDDDDHVAAEDGTGALSFYHLDGLRSVVRTTDSSGAVTLTRQYDAFGDLQSGAAASGFAFTGREWDPQTALYYYRARYYSARDGRFISEDPIGFGGGINFYAYVLNSPPNYLDPSGREVQVCCAKAEILGGLVDHCWIKTDTYESGLGVAGQPACQNAPMPGEPGGGGAMTQVVDHSACGAKRNPVCTPVTNVCESCVDDFIKVGPNGLGKPMGLWTPANNCQTFVKAALTSCSTKKNRSRWFTLGGRISCGGD